MDVPFSIDDERAIRATRISASCSGGSKDRSQFEQGYVHPYRFKGYQQSSGFVECYENWCQTFSSQCEYARFFAAATALVTPGQLLFVNILSDDWWMSLDVLL